MAKDKDDTPKTSRLTAEDHKLWDFVTASVKPLSVKPLITKPNKISGPDKTRKPGESRSSDRIQQKETSRLEALLPVFGMKPADTPKQQDFVQGGIDRRTADRLRRGAMAIEARLDLHGLHQGEAQAALTRFLLGAYDSGHRCVLVITGKGSRSLLSDTEGGVLRRTLPVWLGMSPLASIVLLHSTARAKDGGAGAFYILLRRRR